MRKLLALLMLLVAVPVTADEGTPLVVLISLDGMRHDYPAREGLDAFHRVLREGGGADRLTPVYTSNTFPGHVAMATGTYPDVNGIVDNTFIDRGKGRYHMSADADWLLAEPLWIASTRQGIPTATYFWVGSETPWRGQEPMFRMAPFDGRRPESEKVRQMLEWLALPEGERPRLIMSYFAGGDHVAHDFGPTSDKVQEQLLTQDQALGELLQGVDRLGLWPRLTLILVSDHGMTPMGDYVDLGARLERAGIQADVVGSSVAHVHLADPGQAEAAMQALAGIPGTRVLSGAKAQPLRLAPPSRMGDVVVLADPPVTFSRPGGWQRYAMATLRLFGWNFGGHGYAPDLPDMGGIFLAMGRGVPPGSSFGTVHQVQVAPTVAALLAIAPPLQSEGGVVPGLRIPQTEAPLE
ncbi:MAG: alkaline phosphatase family protein [Pseudomonadales bacterium]|nr:alkaline phosphatase family protein [Pseudomonadales bacterium]